jgi:hypothetical protein
MLPLRIVADFPALALVGKDAEDDEVEVEEEEEEEDDDDTVC